MRIFNNLMQGGGKSDYRSDIDGLRAIACIAVVLFHAFPTSLKGGFVGVDIFFVISGYLISSILYRNLFNPNVPGKVNIVDFYIRRIRRIFPALLAVLITMLVLGWFMLLPDEYSLLGKHTFGGATYINNFMLYKETGSYFDVNSNTKPLLHLWSLGVEEQFYLIFPVFLWLIYKSNLNFVLSLTVFTVISFILNKNAINHNHQSAAFYLPWYRFWELSIGAILAYLINYHKDVLAKAKAFIVNNLPSLLFRNSNKNINESDINNAISVFGLLVILFGIFTVENNYKFPGSKALIPVIGALMIIGAGKEAFINKHILSNKVMVFLGLISYPLYLWHWPLLSLAYICEGELPEAWIRWSAVGIALVLATFTFIVIEPPLRYGNYPRVKAFALLIFLIIVGFVGVICIHNNGFKNRFSNLPLLTAPNVSYKKYKTNEFFSIDDKYIDNCKEVFPIWNESDTINTCAMQKKQNHNTIAIIGSSHATHLFYGLATLYDRSNNGIALFPMGGQSPFYGLQTVAKFGNYSYKRIEDAYDYVIEHKNIKVVILSDFASNIDSYIDTENPSENNKDVVFENCIRRSIEKLKDRKVVIVLDTPSVPFDPSLCSRRPYTLTKERCTFNRNDSSQMRDYHNKIIRKVVEEYSNVELVDPEPLFCESDSCILKIGSEYLYVDSGHLSFQGSLYVGKYIKFYIDQYL